MLSSEEGWAVGGGGAIRRYRSLSNEVYVPVMGP
jgi:hypothetical protein